MMSINVDLIKELQDFIDEVKNSITEGNLPLLLLLIVVFLYAFVKPGGEVITSFPSIPNWYPFCFWLLEGTLIILVFALLISKPLALFVLVAILAILLWFSRRLFSPRFSSTLTQVKEWWNHLKLSIRLIVLCAFAAIAISLFYFPSQFQQPRDTIITFANEPDRFSFGENILIDKEAAFKGEPSCQEHWDIKEEGKNAYLDYVHGKKARLEQASKSFYNFIVWCRNDPEAHIYQNNTSAVRHNPIHIAVSVPIRVDGGAFDSQEILRGVALAQAEINEKDGIYGRWLLVGITDDGYIDGDDEAAIAKKIADYFVKKMPGIVGIVGHSGSDATLAAGEIYDKKLVAISPTSTAVRKLSNANSETKNFSALNLSSYIFRTPSNDGVAAKDLISYITEKQQKITKIAIAYEGKDSYSESFKATFRNEFEDDFKVVEDGRKVVKDREECNFSYGNEFDTEKCLDWAQTANALLLIPSSVFTGQESVFNLVKKMDNLYLLGGDGMYAENILRIPEANDIVVAVPWHRSKPDSESRFEKAAIGKFGKKVNWRTAMAYDATQALIKGLEKAFTKCSWLNPLRYAGEAACLRQELKNALSSPDFKADGVLGAGTVSFKNGDRVSIGKCPDGKSDYQVGVLVKAVVRDNRLGYFQTLEPQSSPVCPGS